MNGESSIDIYTLCMHAKLLQWCLTLCDAMDCSPPDFSVHEILQARMLEWVAISSSRASSRPGHRARISCISCTAGGLITTEPLGEGRQPVSPSISPFSSPEACKQRLAWHVRAQCRLILCGPMDYNLLGFSVRGIFQARNTGMLCHSLLQGIFPTQGLNSHLLCLLH